VDARVDVEAVHRVLDWNGAQAADHVGDVRVGALERDEDGVAVLDDGPLHELALAHELKVAHLHRVHQLGRLVDRGKRHRHRPLLLTNREVVTRIDARHEQAAAQPAACGERHAVVMVHGDRKLGQMLQLGQRYALVRLERLLDADLVKVEHDPQVGGVVNHDRL